jgi:hypothetical protein
VSKGRRKPRQKLAVPIDEKNEPYEKILRPFAWGRRRLKLHDENVFVFLFLSLAACTKTGPKVTVLKTGAITLFPLGGNLQKRRCSAKKNA